MARGPVGASVRRALLGMEEEEDGDGERAEAVRFCAPLLGCGRLLLRDAEGPVGGWTPDKAFWSRPAPAAGLRELVG